MDRLSLVILALALAGGCRNGHHAETGTRRRVNAVLARPAKPVDLKAFCDVLAKPGTGEHFQLPPLTAKPPPAPAGWRWVNVWATWCKPCKREIPRMQSWVRRLRSEGAQVSLELVSVDDSDKAIATFRKQHPGTPASLRLADPDALRPWLSKLGLGAGAALPIHIFVAPTGTVRCVRVAGIGAGDYRAVRRLILRR